MLPSFLGRFNSTLQPAPNVQVVPENVAASVRVRLLIYNVFVFGVLAVLAWAYFQPSGQRWSLIDMIPEPLRGLPIYAFWFGALGGVVISLKGIYDHGPNEWQIHYNLWHLGRPFSGGIAGAVTYVLLLAVSGSRPVEPVVLAAAFIIGTQERRFFNFLSEVGRLIVQVPGEDAELMLKISEMRPKTGKPGEELMILGQGFQPGVTVRLGDALLADVVVSRDGTTMTGKVPAGTGNPDLLVMNPDGSARVARAFFNYE